MQSSKSQKIVIIGAGVFGLSTALQLAKEGYTNISVFDRSLPPVADGSSVDISRIIRFDYSDPVYARMAEEAYQLWKSQPEYADSFNPTPFMLMSPGKKDGKPSYLKGCMDTLQQQGMPINILHTTQDARKKFPTITGLSETRGFEGYFNENAGWADAAKAIARLRNDCLMAGVSIIGGRAGTVVGTKDSNGSLTAVEMLTGDLVEADLFIFATGAWSDGILNMKSNVISSAQCVAYLRLTDQEMQKYRELPIVINLGSGFFIFPPHKDTNILKAAIHGIGYTNTGRSTVHSRVVSSPSVKAVAQRSDFVPQDALERLRQGYAELLPEMGDRPFEKAHICWYTDTPSSDFIMDFHPDYKNVFLATGGSGQ